MLKLATIILICFPSFSQVVWNRPRCLPPPIGGPSVELQERIRDEMLLECKLSKKNQEWPYRLLTDENRSKIAEWSLRVSYHPESPMEPEKFFLLRKLITGGYVLNYSLLKDHSLYMQLSKISKRKGSISPDAISAKRGRLLETTFPAIAKLAEQYLDLKLPLKEIDSAATHSGYWYLDFISGHGTNYAVALPNERLPSDLNRWLQTVLATTER